jgi:hypothetical protein
LNCQSHDNFLIAAAFVFFQGGQRDLCVFCVRVVDGLAVVSEGLLGESLGVSHLAGALSPGVAIGMQGDTRDLGQAAAADKGFAAVCLLPEGNHRKEEPGLRPVPKDFGDGLSEVNQAK